MCKNHSTPSRIIFPHYFQRESQTEVAVLLIFDPLHLTYLTAGSVLWRRRGAAGLIAEMKIHMRDYLKFVARKIFILVLWFIIDLLFILSNFEESSKVCVNTCINIKVFLLKLAEKENENENIINPCS